MYKRLISLAFVFLIAFSLSIKPLAANSYSRVDVPGEQTELCLSREMYTAEKSVTATSLGLDERLEGITDIFSDKNGKILLLCGEKSRIVSINADYTLDKEITVTDENGEKIDFKGAKGIFSDDIGDLYISDTQNARIIVTDKDGKLKNILTAPDSELLPDDFLYQPVKVAKDNYGYTYILSLGCYYGVLMYSEDDKFLGFYGSSTVKASALDTLTFLWEKLTSNETKKSNSTRRLPYFFTDFCFDSDGYMVTCTGNTSKKELGLGQIRKISNNGSEIMYKRTLKGDSVNASTVNLLEKERDEDFYTPQNLISVDSDEQNFIFTVDSTSGTIYIFDSECNMMSAFGGGYGEGKQLGEFKTPVALTVSGNSLWVADSQNCSVTVFKQTEYGKLICKAQSLYINGDYDKAADMWQQVLKYNRNCQLAYRGLAMVYYNKGDYKSALQNARIASDYSVYDMAWKEVTSKFISDNFVWLFLVALVILIFAIIFIIRLKKNNITLIKNKSMLQLLRVPFHPFNTFEEIKYKKTGSLKIATGITVLMYVSAVLNVTSVGFLYQNTLLKNYNALFTLGSTVGLVLLWSLCNWLVCSMFDGKGYFSEVFIATSYAIAPLVAFSFIKLLFTHILSLSAMNIIAGIETALIVYVFFLVCVAIMKIHEYDFFKFLATGIVTVISMILVLFIILMGVILIKQLGAFVVSLYEEVAYR